MSRFTSESIERVRDAADMVEIVSAYTELRRSGQRYAGLCPFHDERTPSFSVDPREKLYYCFGCEAHGDVFTFVREKEALGFPEAVERLADRYGVELEAEEEDPRAEEARKRRARLAELLDRTAGFYAAYLWESDEAARAREYLAGRGLAESVLREFGVGYAPSAWDRVLVRGQRAGFSVAELEAAGLAQKGRQGRHYDRFRARIMFPIRDARGRMQGFGARAMRADQKPKYLNSAESELYRKSRTLYAIDVARGAIARAGRAVVVEGYTDVLAAHQAGVKEAIAVMGTAITPDQLTLLASHVEEVVLALDADRAGRAAMLRAQRVASGKRVRLRVAEMPEGKDPADLLAGGGDAPERFREALQGAVDVPVFEVRAILADADLSSPMGRDRALDEAVPVLSAMPDSITRDELVREVADRLDADPALVLRRMAGGARPPSQASPEGGERDGAGATETRRPAARLSPRERRERALLAMCVAMPARGREILDEITPEHLMPATARAARWLAEHFDDPLADLPRDDDEMVSVVNWAVVRSEQAPSDPEAIELSYLQVQQAMLERQIAAAEEGGGDPPVELQRRRAEIAERIAHRQVASRPRS